MRSALTPGDHVRVRGTIWRLRDLTSHAGCRALDLEASRPGPWGQRRILLEPFDRPEPVPRAPGWRVVSLAAWKRAFAGLVLEDGGIDDLRAAARADITLLPFQLEPALAVVRGLATRILIADAVGLGKTIQAALVLAELVARGGCERALIVTPAGLRDQWAQELRARFAIEPAIVDAAWMRLARARWPATVNPWSVPGVIVSSLDFVKRPENRRALEPITWDLFVLDEAHGAPAETDRGAVVRALAGRARRVLLLSATPHSGDAAAFAALCGIGAVHPDEPVMMFRRTRADIGLPARRHVHVLRVRPTPAEARMHDQLDAYAARVWAARGDQPGRARLAMIVLLKRAFSSPASLARSLDYRRSHLALPQATASAQLRLPIDDDDGDDAEPSSVLDAPGMEDPAEEDAWLRRLTGLARAAARRESKVRAVARIVAHTSEPFIVFTEYRDTLSHLAGALGRAVPCATLHGGLDRQARQAALRAFDKGAARVLLATDAAGQGLNLQGTCRLVVNMELPWNPVRIEQRIGRVDRIGQARTVHATHLVARGTREATILARLAARLERMRLALGSMDEVLGRAGEMAVAEAMIRGGDINVPVVPGALTPGEHEPPFVGADLREEAAVACGRAADRRLLIRALTKRSSGPGPRSRTTGPANDCTLVSSIRRRRLARSRCGHAPPDRTAAALAGTGGIMCLYRARLVDAGGRLVEEILVPVVGWGSLSPPPRRHDQRRLVADLLSRHGADLLEHATRAALVRLDALRATRSAAIVSDRVRELALAASAPGACAGSRLLQPGLFDSRAAREADRASAGREALERESATKLAALSAEADVSLAGDPDLALVLIVKE